MLYTIKNMSGLETNQLSGIMDVNSLSYKRPMDVSLIDTRSMKKHPFQSQTYGLSDSGYVILNTGSDFVNGLNSYIKVGVDVTTDDVANVMTFGSGSVANLFEHFRLISRSGEVIESIDYSYIIANIKSRWETSLSEFLANKALWGVGSIIKPAGIANKNIVTHTDFILPLKFIFGVFQQNEHLIPSHLLAGSKLEFRTSKQELALQVTGGGSQVVTQFKIKLELCLDSYKLFDVAEKSLIEQMANVKKAGLQFSYNTLFSQVNTASDVNQVNIDIMKSCSKVKKVYFITIAGEKLGDITEDSFNWLVDYTSLQTRIGSHYMPQSKATSLTEYYAQSLLAFGAYNNAVDYGNYSKDTVDGVLANARLVAQTMERNDLPMSGLTSNNSQLVSLQLEFPAVNDRKIFVMLEYTRVASILGSNVIVDL